MLRSLLKDTAIYGLIDFFFKAVAFFTFPLFANVLTPAEYGLLALVTVVGTLLSLGINCGLNNAVQLLYVGFNAEKQHYTRPQLVSTGLYSMACFGIAIVSMTIGISYYYREAFLLHAQIEWKWIAWCILSTCSTQCIAYCLDIVRLNFKPWKFAIFSALQNILLTAATLLAVLVYKQGVNGFLISSALVSFFLIPLSLWVIRKELVLDFKWKLSKELIRFGYPFIFTGLAFWLFGSMDRWLLDFLRGVDEVGIYSIAFKFVSIMTLLLNALSQAWIPYALKIYKEDPLYRKKFSKFLNLFFFFFVLCGICLSLFSQEFLIITTHKAYWPAADLLPYLCMGLACYATSQITALAFSLEKKTYHLTVACTLAAVVNFIFDVMLIPIYGTQGAAIATFIAYLVMTSYYWILTQKLHPLPLQYSKLAISFITIFLFFGFHWWVNTMPWGTLVVTLKCCFVLVFIAVGVFFRIIDFTPKTQRGSQVLD